MIMNTNNTTNKTLSNAKILSWNVQHSNNTAGSKFMDPDFFTNFTDHQIVCLQEIRQLVKFPGYKAFNNVHDDEKYGGVCTLVKHEISSGVSLIKNSATDIVVCKLKHAFFNRPKDIYIVNTYMKPHHTTCKTSQYTGLDTLHELDIIVNDLQSKGEVILCGDFNSRIATELDFIAENENDFIPMPDDIVQNNIRKRNSQDRKCNNYKPPFLDFLINNNICILNGRTLGDFAGKFTCIQPNGASVVDYFITSSEIRQLVNHLTVKPKTIFSDHRPLSLSINLTYGTTKHKSLSDAFEKAPVRYKFHADSKDAYKAIQEDGEIVELASSINSANYNQTTEGAYKLNSDFTKYLQTIADKTLTKTKHTSHTKTNKNPWFDNKCRESKRLVSKAARIVSKFPGSDYLRKNYYKVQKTWVQIPPYRLSQSRGYV